MEKLKELLENGSITQEQFDALINSEKQLEQKEYELEKMIQAKIDKALAQERKEKADIKKRFEKLQAEKLSDEEKQKLEFEEQRKEFEEQRKELQREKLKMYSVKALRAAEISECDETLTLIERLSSSCTCENDIDDIIGELKAWHDKAVEIAVEKRFKDGGYTPNKGSSSEYPNNPYSKEHFNLTEIMKIESTDPTLAAQLKASVGK